MAHEKEKAQYEEDRKNHERPWELWENCQDGTTWTPCLCELAWNEWSKYRRIEPVFEPEYFSGLNWRDALPLVGRTVEFSVTPDDKWVKGILHNLRDIPPHHFIQKHESPVNRCELNRGWLFIRTCPETHKHPTITIGGVELPRPEVDAPGEDTKYWLFCQSDVFKMTWCGNGFERCWLKKGMIHLTKDRAQAWASWWSETVIKEINRD